MLWEDRTLGGENLFPGLLQGLDAPGAYVLAPVGDYVLRVITENAGGLILLQNDRSSVHIDLKGILFCNIQSTAQFNRENDTPQLVHLTNDAGRFQRDQSFLFFNPCSFQRTMLFLYHRSTRANTPDSASFRRFLLFSPWWAPAHLRLKKQKSLENLSLSGAGSFAGAEMRPDKERPAENTYRIVKGLDAVWAHFCPSKPCLPLSFDGMMAKY